MHFMGLVKAKWFKDVHELVSSNVTKPGQSEAAFNKDTKVLCVHNNRRHLFKHRRGCIRAFQFLINICLVSVISLF